MAGPTPTEPNVGSRLRPEPPGYGPSRSAATSGPSGKVGHRAGWSGGAHGNEALTAATGALLLVLFAAEGVTILSLRSLLTWHFVIGMALIGPVALKTGSTVYRFARYYTGAAAYRRKGPPQPLLRVLGPFVVLTSAAVLGTGVLLGVDGPSAGDLFGFGLLFLHKATFVLWCAVLGVHVLAYVWRLPRILAGDWRTAVTASARPIARSGPLVRWGLLVVALAVGAVLAAWTAHLATPWQGFRHH